LYEEVVVWPQIPSSTWTPGQEVLLTLNAPLERIPYRLEVGVFANEPPHQLGESKNLGWYADIGEE
jgi:hypothetical protein